jgi:hypothetical protein
MKSAKAKYEELAQKYFETKDPRHLLHDWDLATALWWKTSKGAKHDGVSESLQAYFDICTEGFPKDWIYAYIDHRDNCSSCGESYRVDNMSVCTHCFRNYCWRCVGEQKKHPNGNPACGCGGELVG